MPVQRCFWGWRWAWGILCYGGWDCQRERVTRCVEMPPFSPNEGAQRGCWQSHILQKITESGRVCIISYCIILYYIILNYIILYYIILLLYSYYIILYYNIVPQSQQFRTTARCRQVLCDWHAFQRWARLSIWSFWSMDIDWKNHRKNSYRFLRVDSRCVFQNWSMYGLL